MNAQLRTAGKHFNNSKQLIIYKSYFDITFDPLHVYFKGVPSEPLKW